MATGLRQEDFLEAIFQLGAELGEGELRRSILVRCFPIPLRKSQRIANTCIGSAWIADDLLLLRVHVEPARTAGWQAIREGLVPITSGNGEDVIRVHLRKAISAILDHSVERRT